MKALIYSIIVIVLSIVVWLHWGGFSNDQATLILALADIFLITAIFGNHNQKTSVKE